MSEINTVSLLNQLRLMAAKAEAGTVEFGSATVPFGAVLQNALDATNQLQQNADALKTRYEMGDQKVGIGEVMVAAQKSNLAFEATLRVRNKMVQAYQDIMNMPI
ncbi:flagellar hook-basal body complex protein FliE [Legionella jamestowniensis]|uniref:Flagellar hook-basal body complex protein FliE n=1 Tax=Legionella jamestowniensis TaxID=455 RepID=A0A0W0UW57_9GAMM|nr:flagellar hook-basal body complex protein FliE [Legionella jamestowniensis]KTD12110.1 flagellar hook-basal body complex protein [Legionella jamestowniensis]OCH98851.1 flagellar hook-basal body complex protein FliE [Legionella jamestowniensis]SFL72431.1 flagellar hook-basal body complex protein FliE [Legionella jamestowniensis DSM 19215]